MTFQKLPGSSWLAFTEGSSGRHQATCNNFHVSIRRGTPILLKMIRFRAGSSRTLFYLSADSLEVHLTRSRSTGTENKQLKKEKNREHWQQNLKLHYIPSLHFRDEWGRARRENGESCVHVGLSSRSVAAAVADSIPARRQIAAYCWVRLEGCLRWRLRIRHGHFWCSF